jgi:hypothetical protein
LKEIEEVIQTFEGNTSLGPIEGSTLLARKLFGRNMDFVILIELGIS